jgi:hypothetical protein
MRLFCDRNWTTAGEAKDRCARSCSHDCALPDELPANLSNAWIAGLSDVAEASAGVIPTRINELGMVEYVEEFAAKLESL